MTFEEFFQKKKIDMLALGKERPQLLEEFQKHFEAMGEKSFDHTKKYWFNKLRKSYPAASPAATGPAASPDSAGKGAPPNAGKPAPKPGFKPRFKAGVTGTTAQAPPDKTETAVRKQENEEEKKDPGQENAAPKPAYKPRFKAGSPPTQKK